MNDIKDRIYNHFFTRKRYFILGKPVLTIRVGKEIFNITGEARDGIPSFKVEHGLAILYFNDAEGVIEFIEARKELQ